MSPHPSQPPGVAVLGAAGYIGRHAVDALLRHGWCVHGLCRVPSAAQGHHRERYEARALAFDATDAAFDEALEGVSCVIHCAGHYDADAGELDHYVDSVHRLAVAACARGLDRLLLISSLAVYGTDPGGPVTLATLPQPTTPYALSRWRAEQTAREALATGRTRLVVVRVPSVVGANMRSDVLRRFFRALRVGWFFHPGRADAVFPCVGVHRLAECLALAADPLAEPPALLQPVDCMAWVELADRYGRATGRRLPRVALPTKAIRFACRVLRYDIGLALNALDSAVHYEDNCPCLVGLASPLPETTDDIDAIISTVR